MHGTSMEGLTISEVDSLGLGEELETPPALGDGLARIDPQVNRRGGGETPSLSLLSQDGLDGVKLELREQLRADVRELREQNAALRADIALLLAASRN